MHPVDGCYCKEYKTLKFLLIVCLLKLKWSKNTYTPASVSIYGVGYKKFVIVYLCTCLSIQVLLGGNMRNTP